MGTIIKVRLDDQLSLNFPTENGSISLDMLQRYIPHICGLRHTSDAPHNDVAQINGKLILISGVPTYYPVYSANSNGCNAEEYINGLIIKYFYTNCTYKEIRARLQAEHSITMAVITIQRRIKRLGLRRKNIREIELEKLIACILNELGGSGKLIGYKAMWLRLKMTYKIDVKQSTVLRLLDEIDPDGVKYRKKGRLRKRKYRVPGPNYLWHIDGYDKIKRYGFAIHGAVDGFSKRVMWLRVASTNNKPEVIVHYDLECIKDLGFMPSIIRSNEGTENAKIEIIHKVLRLRHNDRHSGANSFYKGKSTANERIEKYWRQLRNHTIDYNINMFKELERKNLLDVGSVLQINSLRFCFGGVIEFELQRAMSEWNEHRIRPQKLVDLPSGIPNVMYRCPEKYHARDCKQSFLNHEVSELQQSHGSKPALCIPEIKGIIDILDPQVRVPTNAREALKLFLRLSDRAKAIIAVNQQ